MRVFTHYYPIANTDDGLRWRTLLQFGESWHVLGSAVMKNPGSAGFLSSDMRSITDSALLAQLRKFDNAETASDDWYEFSVDSTMTCVGKLFAQHHKYAGSPLDGVIQIFNIFYVKEADLSKALAKAEMFSTPERMTDCDLENLKAPVYLGFSMLSRHKVYSKVARRFFDKALELGQIIWTQTSARTPSLTLNILCSLARTGLIAFYCVRGSCALSPLVASCFLLLLIFSVPLQGRKRKRYDNTIK